MAAFPYRPHLFHHHLSTPSSSESITHREDIWRQASHSNLNQEMFGQAPGIPTPPNASPLYSGSSSERTLPRHASLLSPYDGLGASSHSQLSLAGSSTTMRSTAPTVSQPVQSGVPLRTEHEWLHANTTHHHQAQPEDTGPAPGGRSLGLCGRLLKFFRVSFRALLYIPIRAAAKRPGHTPSVSQEIFRSASILWRVDSTVIQSRRRSREEVDNGGDAQPQKTDRDSAYDDKAIPTTTPNNCSTPTPPSLGSPHAFEISTPKRSRLPVTTSDGTGKGGVHTETTIGTTEQQHSGDLGSDMPTAQPLSLAPNLALPCSNTSAEPSLFTGTLYTEVSGTLSDFMLQPTTTLRPNDTSTAR